MDLSPKEFRDGLALRYGRSPVELPPHCDGCGESFTVDHALTCRRGGLIIRRHNEVRDVLGSLLEEGWGCCVREPWIKDSNTDGHPALRADLACRGVWEPQMEALFDVRVVDTDAPSYVALPPETIVKRAEEEKKRKYLAECVSRNASFTPLVTSVDGFIGLEFRYLLRVVAERLSERWHKPYSLVMNWVRVKVGCAILRASSMCLRRGRRRWRTCHEFEDGAGIPLFREG